MCHRLNATISVQQTPTEHVKVRVRLLSSYSLNRTYLVHEFCASLDLPSEDSGGFLLPLRLGGEDDMLGLQSPPIDRSFPYCPAGVARVHRTAGRIPARSCVSRSESVAFSHFPSHIPHPLNVQHNAAVRLVLREARKGRSRE